MTCETVAGSGKKDFHFQLDYTPDGDVYFGLVNNNNIDYFPGGKEPDASCWYHNRNGQMYCYRPGGATTSSNQATYKSGDKITVRVTPGVVSFLKNGVLLPGSMGINATMTYRAAFYVSTTNGGNNVASCL